MEQILARGSSPYALLREASAVRDEPIESAGSERDVAEVESEPRNVCKESPYTRFNVSSVCLPYCKEALDLHHTFVEDLPYVILIFAFQQLGSTTKPSIPGQLRQYTLEMLRQLSCGTHAISHMKSYLFMHVS